MITYNKRGKQRMNKGTNDQERDREREREGGGRERINEGTKKRGRE
jgi:hypothetical protein